MLIMGADDHAEMPREDGNQRLDVEEFDMRRHSIPDVVRQARAPTAKVDSSDVTCSALTTSPNER